MEAISGLMTGFGVILTPSNILLCLLGSFVGTMIGVLPGIGPLAALALLLPVTFSLPPVAGVVMLAAIFYGAMYGGSTTSILLNIPGEAASVVTCRDGYQMARQGRAGAALGIAAIGSFVAGTLSVIALTFFAPVLGVIALRFGPPENVALMVLGLVCTLYMITGSTLKGLTMIALGVLLAMIGIDVVNGQERFTFGSINLTGGLDLLAIVIGLFGVSEILANVEKITKNALIAEKIKGLFPTREDWKASLAPMLRGSGLGFLLGLVPGGGPITASFISYAVEQRLAKDPSRFGKGAIEGVAGPEAANNAAVGGGMIPVLSLGIPGTPVTALLLGALVIQGIQPGPLFMQQRPDLFWGIVASMYIGNVFLLILNLPLVGLWVQLLRVPYRVLFPIVLMLSVVGTYSANKNVFDLWVMLSFGVAGYVLRKLEYDLAPFLIAFVLAPLLEQSLRQSLVMSPDGIMIMVQRPIAAGLIAIAFVLVALMIRRGLKPQETGGLINEIRQ
ncbi:tripartite tricarboxylate transporter permease [Bosea caraganae]|uniref:Tripartite tricarboxylate transporter permease n=1 Tax=Bosea caraganae TaxID=2763117 RepID=A0A370KXH8_9HYPH|nr:tripartite tricarboxylate transporter permease [Bosea caraganae]RDJ19693.1 tripartite tricarboxylate transporter permease [Bosea caraganae]RDJ24337.1 tripartite tricarboxylate transporter permease [Bosea caraganae]